MSKRNKQSNVIDITEATKSVHFFRNCTGFLDAVSKISLTFKGKIDQIKFLKLKKGVSQVLTIKFPDGSAVNITKYLPYDGKLVVSIKENT
jgi:hypothetical protein